MKLTKGKIAKLYNKNKQTLRNHKHTNQQQVASTIKKKKRLNLSNKTLKRTR
jgi:hypothetical protein